MRITTLTRILAGASGAALAFASLPAAAQTAPSTADQATPETADNAATAPGDQAAPQEEVVVTGSRIARPEFSTPNPIQAYDAENIAQSGETNLTQFLVNSPALLGSQTSSMNAGSNATTSESVGANFLDLRNLGVNRTLVLVDGRRHVAGAPGTAAVDINTIPLELIERVDVLTGGASAIYGADGVSGVVNFIMKRDFEGLRVRAQSGISERGDAASNYLAVTGGHNFADGRGNLTASYEYAKDDRFSQTQRLNYGRTGPTYRFVRNQADIGDISPTAPDNLPLRDLRYADTSPGGAIDLDQDFVPDFTGEGKVYDTGAYVAGSPFTIGGDSTRQDIYFGDTNPALERHVGNVLGSFEVSPALHLFANVKYAQVKANTFSQPSYDLYTQLYQDNAYLNQRFGALVVGDALLLGRDNFDFGVREATVERKTFRSVLGADGRLSDHLKYEVSYTFGQTKATSTQQSRVRDRYYAALDSVVNPLNGQITCRINLPGQTQIKNFGYIPTQQYGTLNPITGNYEGPARSFTPGQCVPLNVLGNGSPSQAAIDFVFLADVDHTRIRQHVLSGSLSGDTGGFFNLPGGPVGFAVGGEYRRESSNFDPSDLTIQGLLLDSSQASADSGKFNVKEAFGEINLPIISDGFIKTLSLGGAARFSDYSTIGKTTTWSINGLFAPIEDISFRGTLGHAVRAPNLSEFFANPSGTYEFIQDPCGIDRITDGSATRQANCTTALTALGINPATFDPANDQISPENTSILGRTGGNRNLQEEAARTWTAGIVLRPRFIRNLQISADWYDIRIRQAINTATAQELVELCYDQPTLTNPFCGNVTRAAGNGYVTDFLVQPANVASFKTAGLDVVLNYRLPTETLGTFNFHLAANYLHKLQFVPSPGADVDNDLGESGRPAPHYSGNADLTWKYKSLTVNYGINYFSKTLRYTREQVAADPDITSPEFLKIKARWEHQLQIGFDVDERFTFYAGANNLLDTKPDVGLSNYPISGVGRFLYAGFRAKIF